MGIIVIGVGDMAISDRSEDTLVTYSLGSCIGVAIYDPRAKVGGILHYMLPESKIDPEKAKKNPAMFGDTGIPLLFKSCYALGAKKQNLIVKVAGGANILDEDGVFNIGKRNYMILKKLFWRNNIRIAAEHVGGKVNRTVKLEIGTGKCFLKVSGEGEFEF